MAVHEYIPTHYHNTLGWHDPVLEIDPGDTVVTTTVDARGQDHTGARVTQRGNPQTGPFFLRGAEPGDALVVNLDELTPNRSWGFTGCAVAPNVLDPGTRPTFADDLGQNPAFDGAPFFRWAVDVAAGDSVSAGDKLLTLEAMKMEHTLTAPFDGTVAELNAEPGAQVQVEALLALIEADGGE